MTRRQWIERFGIYFLGIAIGLIIVGFINHARTTAMRATGVNERPVSTQAPANP